MTSDKMRQAGKIINQASFSDEDLELGVEALELVSAFLQGAGYCGRIWGPLETQRSAFISYQMNRERE